MQAVTLTLMIAFSPGRHASTGQIALRPLSTQSGQSNLAWLLRSIGRSELYPPIKGAAGLGVARYEMMIVAEREAMHEPFRLDASLFEILSRGAHAFRRQFDAVFRRAGIITIAIYDDG